MPTFRRFLEFLSSVVRHGTILLTSSVVAGGLTVWEHREGRAVHWPAYATGVALALLWATFRAWNDERAKVDTGQAEIARLSDATGGLITRKITDPLFWFLSLVERYGARRFFNYEPATGSNVNALFIGETPISVSKSEWIYGLAENAITLRLLAYDAGAYVVPADIRESLAAERRSTGRKPIRPDEALYDARTGQPVDFEI